MSRSAQNTLLEPVAYRNGIYPHDSFPKRRRRLHLRVMDWGGALAVGVLLSGLFLWAAAVFVSGLWALLWMFDQLARRFS